ncbi:MAG: dihydroxyacetone kinase subunit L [Eubacteriales bacterium]|nr:dihydroxyacetone kinase subunit L [Eubacteriales bacterium]
MYTISQAQVSDLFRAVAQQMSRNRDLLCQMDAVMGDGDLGLTMAKGFGALPELFDAVQEADLGKRLMKAGMGMASAVPSTMGTLMSSGIMSGGKKLSGREGIDAEGLCLFLEGFCEGIQKRGKCVEGDRTVLDAFAPAARAARESGADDLLATARAALAGAQRGLEATKTMTPKFGKAAVHSAAAAGREDQGAYAGMLLLQGVVDFVEQQGDKE